MWQRIAGGGIQALLASRRCPSPFPQTTAAATTAAGDRWRISNFEYVTGRSYAAPAQASKAKGKTDADESKGPRINKAITAPVVRLVSENGHGIVSIKEALDRAMRLNLDLVEVQRTANPPVCKIMDFHKEKFKQDVKEKERAKSKSAISLKNGQNKEVRFKGKTELKDLKIKADSIIRLMERGYRVKCTAMPTGKDEEDLGPLLSRLLTMIEDVSVVESGPHVDSKQAYAIVKHVKYAKPGKKVTKVLDSVAKGIQSAVHKTPLAANNTSQTVQGPDAEDVWEPVDSDSDAELAIPFNQADINSSKEFDNVSGFISKAETVDSGTKGQMGHVFSHPTPGDMNISKPVPKPGLGSLRSLLETVKEPSVVETNRYSRRTEANGRSRSHMTENSNNNFSHSRGASNYGRASQELLRQGHQNTHDSPSSISQVNNSPMTSHPSSQGRLRMTNNPNVPKSSSQGYGNSSSRSSTSSDESNLRNAGTGDVNDLSPRRPSYGTFSSSKVLPRSEQRNLGDETVRKNKDSTSQTPRFGVFVSTKAAVSTDKKTSDATSKSVSPSNPAKKYGIFSATETASSSS